MSKNLTKFFFVLFGLPLVAYPFVLLANVMSLAGQKTGNETLGLYFMYGFVALTTSYPLSYLYAFISARKLKFEQAYYLLYPLVHVLLVLLFAYLWSCQ